MKNWIIVIFVSTTLLLSAAMQAVAIRENAKDKDDGFSFSPPSLYNSLEI